MRPPPDVIVIAGLAVAQGLWGILRALQWVRIGSDLMGRGLVVMPVVGSLAIARGAVVLGIAILYVAFAGGALTRRPWARAVGFAAILLNGLAVVGMLIGGEPAADALPWAVVPVVFAVYLRSPAAHRALER